MSATSDLPINSFQACFLPDSFRVYSHPQPRHKVESAIITFAHRNNQIILQVAPDE